MSLAEQSGENNFMPVDGENNFMPLAYADAQGLVGPLRVHTGS